MTEVPEHLLARSRDRRAALGLGGGDAGAAPAAAAAESTSAAVAETGASAPAAAAAPVAPVVREVPPPPAYVQAALERKKMPWWAASILALLPLWAIVYAGSLSPADTGTPSILEEGGTIYAERCATCHGATGGGGVGPALAGGVVLETFPNRADHLRWVYGGSAGWPAPNYGDTNKPVAGGMPNFNEALTPEELLAVVRYEREVLSGEVIGDIEGEVLGADDVLLVTDDTGTEVDSLIYYFGETAEGGTYTIVGDEPFINGAEYSAPAE